MSAIERIRSVADPATLYALAGNAATALLGPVTATLVATHFSPELQGYYYTFGGLMVLGIVVDLGLGGTLVQLFAHVHARDDGPRLRALARGAMRWSTIASVVFIAALLMIGHALFSRRPLPYFGPWLIFVAFNAFNVLFAPLAALVQGCAETRSYWFFKLVQQVVNSVALWVGIAFGFGLWACALSGFASFAWMVVWLCRHGKLLRRALGRSGAPAELSWLAEVWPLQWRVALGIASALITTRLLVPAVFPILGPAIAGQLGLTLTLCFLVEALGVNLVTPKTPAWGALVANGNAAEATRRFRRLFPAVLAASIVACATAIGALLVLQRYGVALGERALPAVVAAGFLFASVFNAGVGAVVQFFRASKRAPLSVWLFSTGFVILGLDILVARSFGIEGASLAHLVAVIALQAPAAIAVWSRWRRELISSAPVAFVAPERSP